MKASTRIQKIFLWILILISVGGLTGCVKVEVSTEVKSNGSGLIGVAIGLTSQAKSMMVSQGGEAGDAMNTLFNTEDITEEGFQVTNWIDGEYEWTKAEKEVSSTNEINEAFSGNELFSKYSLTHNRGLLQDEFILDAEITPLADNAPSSEINIPITSILGLRYSIKLPGKIVETNGIADVNDPNRLFWTAQEGAVPMQARATSWNWLNMILLLGGAFLILAAIVVILFLVIARSSKKSQQIQSG
jgi:hypothetical protein